jgi:AcrR family transcriptional regulator
VTTKATAKKKDSAKTTTRPRLSRDRVVANALTLVDREGLDGLTMRALGGECGCDPMGIYRHVKDKDELLDAMVDAIWSEIELPEQGLPGTWQEQFREAFRIFRNAMSGHPNAIPMMFRRSGLTGSAVHRTEFALDILISAGFDPVDAMWGLDTVSCYVLGCVLGQAGHADQEVSRDEAIEAYARLSPTEVPHLASVMMSGADFGKEEAFERGLDLIVGGLEQLLAKTNAPA